MITQGLIEDKPGIYCIENIINKKKYIGSAKSIEKRRNVHLCELRANKHKNSYLQYSFNKYGEGCFVFYPICYCKIEELITKENEYMKLFNSVDRKNGYNLKNATQTVISEETRKKLSLGRKGKKATPEQLKRMSDARKGFKNSEESKIKVSKSLMGHAVSEETRKKIIATQSIKIDQLDLDGNYIKTFDSCTAAAKELGKKIKGNINQVCNGKAYRKTASGFKWRYNEKSS